MTDGKRIENWLRGLREQDDMPGTHMVHGPLSMLRVLGAEIVRLQAIADELQAALWEITSPNIDANAMRQIAAKASKAAKAKEDG